MAELQVLDGDTIQYIVVKIGDEEYGINISYVDNIIRMQKITRVPKAQSYFKGVINLRGEIVPVMSIRKKMGLEEAETTGKSRIIVLKVEEHGALGIIVDAVNEVVTLSPEQIDKPARDSKSAKNSFIDGIGKNGDELISLFDINSILDEKEVVS